MAQFAGSNISWGEVTEQQGDSDGLRKNMGGGGG